LVGPFQLQVPPDAAWPAVQKIILKFSRTQVMSFSDDYLNAACQSAVFGFVNDLGLQLRPEQKLITI
jgi:uncharacterized protein (DUF1499 family)